MTGASILLVAPLVIPFSTAAATYLARRNRALRRGLSAGGGALLFVAAAALFATVWRNGPIGVVMGGWSAPFGIGFVADTLAASMALISAGAGLAVTIYGLAEISEDEEARGHSTLAHALIGGAMGGFLTSDLFNLYVWFEVTLIASFGLLALRRGRAQIDAAVKYVAMNLVATAALLLGVGALYGATGSLSMADLHVAVRGRESELAIIGPAALLLFAFSVKAGLFPLFFWLPASYHTPSVTVSALFSALLTKLAVYALYRMFTLVFDVSAVPHLQTLLIWVACLTMAVGVLGAAAQTSVRRILSFHIVSQIGYMIFGLALGSAAAIAGGLFYMAHNILTKTNLFLTGGIAARLCGSEKLAQMGGLWAARPWLSLLFLISALSMAGIPPLSGFWAKFLLVRESLTTGFQIEAAIALAVGLLTLFSMTKIWAAVFWAPHPDPDFTAPRPPASMVWPALILAALIVLCGLFIGPVYAVAERAAAELSDPAAYLAAARGGAAP